MKKGIQDKKKRLEERNERIKRKKKCGRTKKSESIAEK